MQVRIAGSVARSGQSPNDPVTPVVGLTVAAYELKTERAVGSAQTASDGTFVVFGDLVAADAVVAFVVMDGDVVIADTRWDAIWTPNAQAPVAITLQWSTANQKIYGTVKNADGTPVDQATVKIFPVVIQGPETNPVLTGSTDSAGYYELGPIAPTELVIVQASAGVTVLATSPQRLGTGRVDLIVESTGNEERGTAEYDRINAAVMPLLNGVPLKQVTTEQVAYLAARTGLEPAALSTFMRAARLAQWPQTSSTWMLSDASLAHDFVYALVRMGHPQTLEEFLAGRQQFQAAWDAAVAANIVADRTPPGDISGDLAAIDALLQRRIAQASALGPAVTAGTLLSTDVDAIKAAYTTHNGSIASFWSNLSLPAATKTKAQDALRLDIIADGHGPLIENLLADRAPQGVASWQTTRDLATWAIGTWSSRFVANPSLIPAEFLPAAPLADRATEYAKQVRRHLSRAYPTVLVTADLARGSSTFTGLRDFAISHAEYEMSVKPMRQLAHENVAGADALVSVADPIERLFRLVGETDRSETIAALRAAGYGTGTSPGSALEIVRRGRTAFVTQMAAIDSTVANIIFDRALQVYSLATSVVARYAKAFTLGSSGMLAPPELPGGIAPDWATIFGSLDYCACDECQSVLSPAAYLVAQLQFLRDLPAGVTPTAWTVLDGRRPDISDMALTCANTNTAMPHIDLVNELLERRITPTGAPVLGTSWTANELAIHPEHLHVEPYKSLAEKIFPLSMPYDIWLDEVRSYLRVLGWQRADVRAAFLDDPPADLDTAYERIGLSPRDASTLTGTSTPEELWGFTSGSAATTLANVPTFLSRVELTYEAAADLLATNFVKGAGLAVTARFTGSGCDLATATLPGSGATPPGSWDGPMADRLSRFERLRRRTGLSVRDLDHTLAVFAPLTQHTATTVAFTQPAANANVQIAVGSTTGLTIGDHVFVTTGGKYQVVSVDSATLATLKNLGYDGNASAGIAIAAASSVKASGSKITSAALQNLSHAVTLSRAFNTPLWEVLGWWSSIDTQLDDESSSRFERIFVDRARSGTHPFRLNGTRTELAEATHVIYDSAVASPAPSDVMPELTRALGLRADQIIAIAKRVLAAAAPATVLYATVSSLSALYRYLSLARAQRLDLDSYLIWLDVWAGDLSTTSNVMRSWDDLRSDRAAGVTPRDAAYVLRGDASQLDPTDEEIVKTLSDLRSELQKVAAKKDTSLVPGETDGEKTERTLRALFPAAPDASPPADVGADLWALIDRTTPPPVESSLALIDSYFRVFMLPAEIATAKEKLVTGPGFLATQAARYAYVLPFVVVAQKLQEEVSAVVDAIAEATSLTSPVASTILRDILKEDGSGTKLSLETFRGLAAITDLTDRSVAARQTAFSTYRRVHKLALLARRFSLTEEDLRALSASIAFNQIPTRSEGYTKTTATFTQPAVSATVSVVVGSTAWMTVGKKVYLANAGTYSVSSITNATTVVLTNMGYVGNAAVGATVASGKEVTSAEVTATPLAYGWWRTVRLHAATRTRANGRIADLVLDSSSTATELLTEFAKRSGLPLDDLTFLAGPTVLNFTTLAAFLPKAIAAMDVVRSLGLPASVVWALRTWPTVVDAPSFTERMNQAKSVKDAVLWRVPEPERVDAIAPVRNAIRERQRDALISYARSDGAATTLTDIDVLGGDMLIDLSTSSCMKTSRLKQALLSIQEFVQRASLGLETVTLSAVDLEPWKWMKNYRVWEANRKVFLWPENWIEPELRDDKTEFFRDLENVLLQDELDDDAIEKAYTGYLRKLDQVAHLQLPAMYHQPASEVGEDTLYVFGRTFSVPHQHYWRQRRNGHWYGWEKLDLGIEGEHLIPVVHDRRMFLFWPKVEEVAAPDAASSSGTISGPYGGSLPSEDATRKSIEGPPRRYQIRMSWASRFAGEWSENQTTDAMIPIDPKLELSVARVPPWTATLDELQRYPFGPGLTFWATALPSADGDLFVSVVTRPEAV